MGGLSCEFNVCKALGVVIPTTDCDPVAFCSMPLFSVLFFSALPFILLETLITFFPFIVIVGALGLSVVARDALSPSSNITITVWYLGKPVNSCGSSVSFGFGTRDLPKGFDKATIALSASQLVVTKTLNGSWVWGKFFYIKAMDVEICVGSI